MKWKWGIAAATLTVAGMAAGVALASGYDVAANCTVAPLRFVFDGAARTPQVANGNPPGFICNGTAYVPIRFMADSLNQQVGWDPASYTISVSPQPAPQPASQPSTPPSTQPSTSPSTPPSTQPSTQPSAPTTLVNPTQVAKGMVFNQQGIYLFNPVVGKDAGGTWHLQLTATNSNLADEQFALTVNFYGTAGAHLGSVSAVVRVDAGGSQKVDATTTSDLSGFTTVNYGINNVGAIPSVSPSVAATS